MDVEFRRKGGKGAKDAETVKVVLSAAAAAGRLGVCRYTASGAEPLADAILREAGVNPGAYSKGELSEPYRAAMFAMFARPTGAL